jgi:putative ABC transport system permease protein
MDSELRFHLENQTREYMNRGMSLEEAQRRARQGFGPLELAKDECRDARRLVWLGRAWRDLRLAVRSLRRAPGFAIAAIVTLALGIGANTAVFSVVYSVLLKPLPYENPDELYTVDITIPERLAQLGALTGRIQDYLEWRDADTAFSGVATITPAQWNLTGTGEPERVGGARVSTNFFSLLGVPPEQGRGFAAEEEQPGRDRVVVISNGLWRRRYGADPAIVGKTIDLNGQSHIVAGIAQASLLVPTGTLRYLNFGPRVDVWKPLAPTAAELEGENWNQVLLLRLQPGESAGQPPLQLRRSPGALAKAERGRQQLQALLNAPGKALPPGVQLIPRLRPIRDIYAGELRMRLLLLLGASTLLLLVACTNIASLFLARLASRSTEFATRIALGAGRAGILLQMLAESTVLALFGGVVGALVAYYGVRVLVTYGPDVALLREAGISTPVLFFAVLASLLTGVACGMVPAFQAYRRDPGTMLQEGSRRSLGGARASSFRQALVSVEIALGTALLASAALLLHSFVNVMNADRGYEVQNVLAVDLALSGERYSTGPQRVNFYRLLTENIASLPGVLAAGAISEAPVAAESGSQAIFLDTDTDFEAVVPKRPVAGFREVTPGYFAASGSSLVAGRFFEPQDRVTTAIISESLARSLWPGQTLSTVPGRRIRQGDVVDQRAPLLTIVGVIRNVRAGAVDRAMLPQLYRPHLPPRSNGTMTVIVRTSSAAETLAPAVRNAIRRMDSNLPVPAIQTLQQIVMSAVAERRFQMLLTSLFAVIALLLGAVGVYGVVSYTVACRTRDIGLRLALGATRQDIMRWVVSTGMRPVVIGLVIGLGSAIAIATALRGVLFGVAPTNPVALGGVAGLLLATAAAACYIPALRASRLDPVVALRGE